MPSKIAARVEDHAKALDSLSGMLDEVELLDGELGVTADRGQRRADLMGQGGEELGFRPARRQGCIPGLP